uniref:Uncharacterized protein n=1 Tax=uncultured marine virus TaxID=186617 RepID=A0A0F7L4V3_9VIRU|nr:hypothetical protein [uncultured marine virus]
MLVQNFLGRLFLMTLTLIQVSLSKRVEILAIHQQRLIIPVLRLIPLISRLILVVFLILL